jgi:hypothetical protein
MRLPALLCAVALILPAPMAGRLSADDAQLTQLHDDLTALTTQEQTYADRELFILQVIAIQTGFSLGFTIWACWLAGRQSRNP